MTVQIHTLNITHRLGEFVSAYASEAECYQGLVNYVKEEWEKELPGEEQPEVTEELIAQYFEDVDGESYTINSCMVEIPDQSGFHLYIELGNAQMQSRSHVAKALNDLAWKIAGSGEHWLSGGAKILDANGNSVGEWKVVRK